MCFEIRLPRGCARAVERAGRGLCPLCKRDPGPEDCSGFLLRGGGHPIGAGKAHLGLSEEETRYVEENE